MNVLDNKRLVCGSNDAELITFVVEVCRGLGIALDVVSDREQLLLNAKNQQVVLVDQNLDLMRDVAFRKSLFASSKTIYFASLNYKEVIDCFASHNDLRCILCRDSRLIASELKSVLKNLFSIGAPGIGRYLDSSAEIRSHNILEYRKKDAIFNEIKDDLRKLNYYEDLAENFLMVTWELLMNAVFDAPVDENGSAKYTDRIHEPNFSLQLTEQVELNYGWNDDSVVVSVKDCFGRIRQAGFIENVSRCIAQGADQVRFGPAGAGLGLYLILYQANQIDYYVEKGRVTIATGVIYVSKKRKDVVKRSKTVNFYYK